ncbi:MAG: energy transducer TonB [Flavobacterium sp.]|nr:MAG: energy transducer TonB [Flavobacterium sp.]
MLNNSSNLYGSEWLALVFSNRNQNYGAYVLRLQSASILLKSLCIAAPLFIMAFVGPSIYAYFKPAALVQTDVVMQVQDIEPIHEMKKEEPKKEEIKKELPKPEPVLEKVKTVNLSANIKVVDKEFIPEPPITLDLKTAVIGSETSEGKEGVGNSKPIDENIGKGGGGTGEGKGEDNTVYNTGGIEKFPEFPGGMAAWSKFIQKNLRYPYMAQDAGIQGKVYISFVVEKDGSITDVSVMRGIGGGCDEEAMRVIKKSPKWSAGEQNNTKVRVRYNMPINYTITQ